mmetsp:Transcript_19964/g.26024  ORF Transcript_19964/g.26024 Transcript_19964/m.26024 type:complete len:132 (+) Transcript_19964:93-488(+)
MSSTEDFEQLYMSSVENIKVMLSQEFKINDPHPFQLYAIFILTFILGKLLVVQKTGAGKSLIIYGALRLLGGVAIVVEPLIAVASDQTIAAITRWIIQQSIIYLLQNVPKQVINHGIIMVVKFLKILNRSG